MPQMAPKMWKNNEIFYEYIRSVNRSTEMTTRSMKTLVNRFRCAEVFYIRTVL